MKTKGKLSGLSKNLFGAFGHKGVSKKKSNDLNEGKTLNSPQKAESRTIGEQQVENEPSSKATSKAEIPKDTSQTTLTTSLSSSSSTTTTTTTTTTDEPVKALLYTTALDDTPSDGDDDGTHSVATGCTIKGGPCSPSSIGDLSTLDSLPPSATSTLELDGNRTKPDKVKEGWNTCYCLLFTCSGYLYLCVCLFIYVRIFVCDCMFILGLRVFVFICVCTLCLCLSGFVYFYLCAFVFTFVYVCVYVCMF